LHDLEIDIGKQWKIERGFQLAIQNLLDIGRIYKILHDQLEDFKTFCRLIIEYLEQ